MKIDRISYSESIEVYAGKWIKVGMEAELFDGDIIESSYASLKKLVSDQFATNSTELSFPRKGAGGLENYITPSPSIIDRSIERLEILIDDCKTKSDLYRIEDEYGAKIHSTQSLSTLFKSKLEELSK